jgi:acetyl esterase/lipase
VLITLTAAPLSGAGAHPAPLPAVISIWEGKSADSQGSRGLAYSQTFTDLEGHSHVVTMIRDVRAPTLTAFWPRQVSREKTAVIICPGGGFRFLGWQMEGTDLAKWLAARGVAAFVLRYRLVPTAADAAEFGREMTAFMQEFSGAVAAGKHPRSLEDMLPDPVSLRARALASADASEAVKVVRRHALAWGIATDRIGMLGFSAGGFLVTDVVLADDPATRLNFAALLYGGELGQHKVPADAPPLFVTVAQDDPWMSGPALQLFSKWTAAGKPIELHYFHEGGHGFGTLKQGLPVDQWPHLLARWLASQKLMAAARE